MKVLVVEDQVNMLMVYRMVLEKANHQLSIARDGSEAIPFLQRERFDAVITDWMMPKHDGLELIRWIRTNMHPAPPIIMVTSLGRADELQKAIDAGADEYLVKPIVPKQLLSMLARVEKKQNQQIDTSISNRLNIAYTKQQSFYAVAIAAGSGAGSVLEQILSKVASNVHAVFLIVVHNPGWALEALVQQLSSKVGIPIALAIDGQKINPGKIFLAPDDRHMVIDPDRLTIQLENSEPENFVRPAADPLMRSVARAFGSNAVGVILGGMGCDGAIGAGFIHTAGGTVLVLDPAKAAVPQMSQHSIESGMADYVLKSEDIIKKIQELL